MVTKCNSHEPSRREYTSSNSLYMYDKWLTESFFNLHVHENVKGSLNSTFVCAGRNNLHLFYTPCFVLSPNERSNLYGGGGGIHTQVNKNYFIIMQLNFRSSLIETNKLWLGYCTCICIHTCVICMRTSKKDGYSFQCKMYNKNLALKIYMEYFYTVKKKGSTCNCLWPELAC